MSSSTSTAGGGETLSLALSPGDPFERPLRLARQPRLRDPAGEFFEQLLRLWGVETFEHLQRPPLTEAVTRRPLARGTLQKPLQTPLRFRRRRVLQRRTQLRLDGTGD